MQNKLLITDVLGTNDFNLVKKYFMSERFPWYYQDHVVFDTQKLAEEKYQSQFTHQFHQSSTVVTTNENWQMLFGIFHVLQPNTFIRVKANLIPATEKIVKHGFHIDSLVPLSYTAIYYVNSNNGYTEFEDGTVVPSVENSMVIFPSHINHTGTTCTDQKCRINVNINYVPNAGDNLLKDIMPEGADQIVKKWIK